MNSIPDNEWTTLSLAVDTSENGCLWLTVDGFDELSDDTKAALRRACITYTGELIQRTEEDLSSNLNLLPAMLAEINAVLGYLGLSLGTQLENWPPDTGSADKAG